MNLMFHLYRLRHDISSYEFEFECSSSSTSFIAILAWCLFYLPSGKTGTSQAIYYCSWGIIYLLLLVSRASSELSCLICMPFHSLCAINCIWIAFNRLWRPWFWGKHRFLERHQGMTSHRCKLRKGCCFFRHRKKNPAKRNYWLQCSTATPIHCLNYTDQPYAITEVWDFSNQPWCHTKCLIKLNNNASLLPPDTLLHVVGLGMLRLVREFVVEVYKGSLYLWQLL